MVKKRLDEAPKKRVRAGRLLLKGKKPAEVALAVGVARQTVYTWKALLDERGIDALRSAPSRGRPPRLDESELKGLRRALLQKPTEHGFGTELWTLKRVGVVTPSGREQAPNPTYFCMWNVGTPYRSLRGQQVAKSAYGGAGIGTRTKRTPLCNGADRGCNITSRESGQTSSWSLFTREFLEPT